MKATQPSNPPFTGPSKPMLSFDSFVTVQGFADSTTREAQGPGMTGTASQAKLELAPLGITRH